MKLLTLLLLLYPFGIVLDRLAPCESAKDEHVIYAVICALPETTWHYAGRNDRGEIEMLGSMHGKELLLTFTERTKVISGVRWFGTWQHGSEEMTLQIVFSKQSKDLRILVYKSDKK